MSTRPPELLYAVDERPPPTRLAALGLQYSVLIGIYLIFVVMVARAAKVPAQVIQDLVGLGFIAVAIGAFVQAYRGSLFGSGYLAPPLFSAIYVGPAIMAAEAGGLPAVAGLTIFAGFTEAALSRLLTRLRVIFQPMIAGFTVLVVGVQLGLVGLAKALDIAEEGTSVYWAHVSVSLVTLAVAVGFSIWGKRILRLLSILFGVIAGLAAAYAAGLIDAATIRPVRVEPWFALPNPSFLSYSFEAPLLPALLPPALPPRSVPWG